MSVDSSFTSSNSATSASFRTNANSISSIRPGSQCVPPLAAAKKDSAVFVHQDKEEESDKSEIEPSMGYEMEEDSRTPRLISPVFSVEDFTLAPEQHYLNNRDSESSEQLEDLIENSQIKSGIKISLGTLVVPHIQEFNNVAEQTAASYNAGEEKSDGNDSSSVKNETISHRVPEIALLSPNTPANVATPPELPKSLCKVLNVIDNVWDSSVEYTANTILWFSRGFQAKRPTESPTPPPPEKGSLSDAVQNLVMESVVVPCVRAKVEELGVSKIGQPKEWFRMVEPSDKMFLGSSPFLMRKVTTEGPSYSAPKTNDFVLNEKTIPTVISDCTIPPIVTSTDSAVSLEDRMEASCGSNREFSTSKGIEAEDACKRRFLGRGFYSTVFDPCELESAICEAFKNYGEEKESLDGGDISDNDEQESFLSTNQSFENPERVQPPSSHTPDNNERQNSDAFTSPTPKPAPTSEPATNEFTTIPTTEIPIIPKHLSKALNAIDTAWDSAVTYTASTLLGFANCLRRKQTLPPRPKVTFPDKVQDFVLKAVVFTTVRAELTGHGITSVVRGRWDGCE
ncbi:hypothetical protein HDV05_004139 [Chytridiales sp. JEL 0842]|nr:hypothetical protein HDV05_004139 [Chytridiales sp. JEL 0842]